MSLITEIDRTETEKNKTKQVATNIDNKLVELGGEQAIDLADVPNKMQALIGEYKKMAYIESMDFQIDYSPSNETIVEIPINLQFVPKIAFLYVYRSPNYFWASSIPKSVGLLGCNINYSFTKEKMILKVTSSRDSGFFLRGLFLVG